MQNHDIHTNIKWMCVNSLCQLINEKTIKILKLIQRGYEEHTCTHTKAKKELANRYKTG